MERLADLFEKVRAIDDGDVATYIPALAEADPSWFGLSVMTVDGQRYDLGDADRAFTIQSVSKPFVFGQALEELGLEHVSSHVGVEPSGNPFNSITLDPATGRPFNPMVNSGAIVTSGLIPETNGGRSANIVDGLSRFAGRSLDVDEAVYRSECDTGDRNRAIAYLMRGAEVLPGDVEDVLDAYFRQCSVVVDARDLAYMAATLAHRGRNPLTGEQVLADEHVPRVLSVMTSCGMYDFAGEWTYRVGMPAKSGVSGGIVEVLPGQFRVGVFSPPLDARGNSVRGGDLRGFVRELRPAHAAQPRSDAGVAARLRRRVGPVEAHTPRGARRDAARRRRPHPGT